MTTHDLMLKVKDALESEGFICNSVKLKDRPDYWFQGEATKPDKMKVNLNGRTYDLRVIFQVVNKHNASNDNVSVDIAICAFKGCSGMRICKERLNTKMSEKVFSKHIDNFKCSFKYV